MGEKLTWGKIRQRCDQERIELVDYDWPEEGEDLRAGSSCALGHMVWNSVIYQEIDPSRDYISERRSRRGR